MGHIGKGLFELRMCLMGMTTHINLKMMLQYEWMLISKSKDQYNEYSNQMCIGGNFRKFKNTAGIEGLRETGKYLLGMRVYTCY